MPSATGWKPVLQRRAIAAVGFIVAGIVGFFVGASDLAAADFSWEMIELKGFARLGERRTVLLDLKPPRERKPISVLYEVGEKLFEFRPASIRVSAIDEKAATVTLEHDGEQKTLALDPAVALVAGANAPILNVRNARLEAVLDVYQALAGRTVLRPGSMTNVTFSLKTSPSDDAAQAVETLERAFNGHGLKMRKLGAKFVAVAPSGYSTLAALPEPPDVAAAQPNSEILPSGAIKFEGAEDVQVLEIYKEVTGRKISRTKGRATSTITVKSQTEITRAEMIYLLEQALALSGIKLVPTGPDSVEAIATDASRIGNTSPPGPEYNK